jgi:dephospho-CoA kinase
MRIVGLTGSIGMGKSTTAGFFRAAGVPVHNADEAVHRLYAGAAVPLIEAAFPGTTRDGVVDRAALGRNVLGDGQKLKQLEALIHPLVSADRDAFLERARSKGALLAVLDVPLLFETGGAEHVDVIVVATAPAPVQRARVLERPGMSVEKFEAILAKQMPDAEKRRRAHVVIDTGRGMEAAQRDVDSVVRMFAGR